MSLAQQAIVKEQLEEMLSAGQRVSLLNCSP